MAYQKKLKERFCTTCGKSLGKSFGRLTTCVRCFKENNRKNNKTWWESGKGQKTKMINYRYGMSEEEYEKLLVKQNGRCAICLIPLLEKRHTVLDHDHKTHKVRGILCRKCNTGLGMFDDNAEKVMRASLYLEIHLS